jgi:hypothetical protein
MKFFIISVLALIINHFAVSQNSEEPMNFSENNSKTKAFREKLEPKVTFDLDFRAAAISGDFKKLYGEEGMGGVGASILFPISKNFPVDVGLGFGYYFMSATEFVLPYYTHELNKYKMTSTVTGSMIPIHFVARIYPVKHIHSVVQPYVEGLLGEKLFVVEQISEVYLPGSEVELSSNTESNFTNSLSYGFGLGIKVRISKNNLLYLNTKIDQLFGEEAKYLDATQVTLSSKGTYENVYHYSRTDILRFSIGLHLMIE